MKINKNTPKLITALRSAAQKLLDEEVNYDWSQSASCNCGILAAQMLQITPNELLENYLLECNSIKFMQSRYFQDVEEFSWSELTSHVTADFEWEDNICPDTGIPIINVVLTLLGYGFEPDDIDNLEWLEDKPEYDRTVPEDVARYMQNLALKLEKELANQNVQ